MRGFTINEKNIARDNTKGEFISIKGIGNTIKWKPFKINHTNTSATVRAEDPTCKD